MGMGTGMFCDQVQAKYIVRCLGTHHNFENVLRTCLFVPVGNLCILQYMYPVPCAMLYPYPGAISSTYLHPSLVLKRASAPFIGLHSADLHAAPPVGGWDPDPGNHRLSQPVVIYLQREGGDISMGNTEGRDGAPGAASSGKPFTGFGAADRTVRLELDIQKERMGKLIGTGGKTIREIQQRAPSINFRTPGKDDTGGNDYKFVPVILTGKAQEVFKAAILVDDVATACLAVLTVQLAPREVFLLQRESIQNLQEEIAVDTLRLPRKHDKPPRVVIEGYLEDVTKAYHHILAEVEKAAKEQHEGREMDKLMAISRMRHGDEDSNADGLDKSPEQGFDGKMQKKPLPRERQERQKRPGDIVDEFEVPKNMIGLIVGTKGSTLYKLERDSRASIRIVDNRVRLEGLPSNVQKARHDIERLLRRPPKDAHDGKTVEERSLKWEALPPAGRGADEGFGGGARLAAGGGLVLVEDSEEAGARSAGRGEDSES